MSGAVGAGRGELGAALARAGLGIAIADSAGRLVEVNDACCAITGRSRAELLGEDLVTLTHPAEPSAGVGDVAALLRGEARELTVEAHYRHHDGTDAWGRTGLFVVRDGAGVPAGVVAVTADITTERRTREALRDERRALEAIAGVGRLVSGDRDVTAIMLHVIETATRLTGAAVGGLFYRRSETAERTTTELATFDRRGTLGDTRTTSAVVLDHGGAGSDRATAEPELDALWRAIPEAGDFASRLGVAVTARGRCPGHLLLGHPDPGVFTERHEQLATILAGQAAMALELAQLAGDEHQGLDSAQDPHGRRDDFLSKLSHELRTPLNAMLGWAVMMNSGTLDEVGRARAASTIERNARNQLHLIEDLLDAPTAAEAARRLGMGGDTKNLSRLQGLRVLLVDDQPDSVEVFVPTLTRRGAEVRIAASADEAMAIFDSWTPGVLVSDIAMPDEDGYGLLRRVRARPAEQGGQVPAVALTASGGMRERKRALSAGFQSHVPKPVDRIELALTIANVVGPGHAERESP
jgi:PAS domain S-box-containing protein